ncbi:MAG: LysR family transcriptional regulator [Pseudomonadales bacterium]|nr:LysR family transcriptional regulator [Pseudomonadales bacterium]
MLNLIRVFIKVIETGSFSKAGVVLKMAPSSVARNIDSLEQELGTTLIKRSTRKLVLTEDGHQFLVGAEKLLTQADQLKASMSQVNDEPVGILRISVFESFGRQMVSPILPEFLQKYPKVKIEINLDNQMVDLNRDNIDVGIRIGRPADSCLRARKLLTNHTWLCASPDYLAQAKPLTHPEDLINHNCLLLSQGRQLTHWYFQKNKEHIKVAVNGNLYSKGGTPLLEAAVNGGGIVQMSQWMMLDLINTKQLEVCLADWKPSLHEDSSGEVYAVYLGDKFLRPVLRAFIDFLVMKLEQRLISLNEHYK